MRFLGQITSWNPERGFGFITPAEGVQRATGFEAPAPPPVASPYRCDGRKFCSQMTSCAEATYFLKNCPGTQMDGNNDGVPCESQWCR
ncbi:MAG: excalibur calcium-binding domain-containing protein [Ramlibacter sp.]